MPKDIRSYFQSVKTNSSATPTKATKRRIILSDEDDVKSQSPVKRSKKTKKIGKRCISSDSDDDVTIEKIVSPAAIFGKKPISRQEAPKILKQFQKKESEGHNDVDFEATLSQLDTSDIEQKYLTESMSDKETVSTKHEEHDLHKNNLQNKENKTVSVKNEENVKEKKIAEKSVLEKTDKKHKPKSKKHSNDHTNESIVHESSEDNSKSKHKKNYSKSKTGTSKIEVEYKESKKKTSPKKTEALDIYEERIEKRKQHSAIYQQYLQRGGARHPGSKEIPEGAEYCLAGLSFLITGVLDSLEREEAEELIKKYGGRILHQVSKKTDYVIVGDQAGPSKLSKANSLNIKQISEDDLLEMIHTRSAGQPADVIQSRTKSKDRVKQNSTESEDASPSPPKKVKATVNQEIKKSVRRSPRKNEHDDKVEQEIIKKESPIKKGQIEVNEFLIENKKEINDTKNVQAKIDSSKSLKRSPRKKEHDDEEIENSLKQSPRKKEHDNKDIERSLKRSPRKNEHYDKVAQEIIKKESSIKKEQIEVNEKKEINDTKNVQIKIDSLQDINQNISTQALVEKYRPKTMKQILGQQGDKSNAKKLYTWLMNWHKNQSGQIKHTKPSPWANTDGAFFKAALLSGPPGIGKTTTVQVVCNELGFDLVEFNASDTRSKKLLQQEVSELLSNTTLKDYFIDITNKPTSKHVLLMDEVDGMAGNEDRGGLQELINLIKSTDIPIVCICNDRNNPKMRTLSNYVFDLRFSKPRVEQIRGAMKSICFKENINISTEDLNRLIESTNQDIRQTINHLALFVGKTGCQEKSSRQHINKDLKLGPWDVVRKVFSAEEHKHMNIHDKSDLFFHDYNISPLFVQENYLLVVPQGPKNTILKKVAESADSLALGDMVEKSIRSNGAWSLLPMQACYSSVIPGTVMSGHIAGQINFPSWLGRNSKAAKFNRLVQEITVHTRLATGASKEAINLDYIKPLRDNIIKPLVVDGVEGIDAAMNVMNHYHLLREDLDALVEISLWPGNRDLMQDVDSKVKAAFTRAYNKNSVAVPYIISGTTKKKTSVQDEGYLEEEEAENLNSDNNDDDVDVDKMIKAKKPTASKKTESKGKSNDKIAAKGKSSDKPSKRGRGRGKAK